MRRHSGFIGLHTLVYCLRVYKKHSAVSTESLMTTVLTELPSPLSPFPVSCLSEPPPTSFPPSRGRYDRAGDSSGNQTLPISSSSSTSQLLPRLHPSPPVVLLPEEIHSDQRTHAHAPGPCPSVRSGSDSVNTRCENPAFRTAARAASSSATMDVVAAEASSLRRGREGEQTAE